MDKAGPQFWNDSWAASALVSAVDPSDRSLLNAVNRRFHALFARLFERSAVTNARLRLLEIGCANSGWLPYFAKQFGFQVCGLDYSPIGAEMSRQMLQANGVAGEIVCSDLFTPPPAMLGQFDVVVSFGVAEHFEDTRAYLAAAAAYLKPGGMLITSIPNMVGWNGTLQKLLNRQVYDIHELIDPARLTQAHVDAGLQVVECDYFTLTNFGVVSLTGVRLLSPLGFAKKVVLAVLARVSMLTWALAPERDLLRPNRMSSPYINCVARKPEDGSNDE